MESWTNGFIRGAQYPHSTDLHLHLNSVECKWPLKDSIANVFSLLESPLINNCVRTQFAVMVNAVHKVFRILLGFDLVEPRQPGPQERTDEGVPPPRLWQEVLSLQSPASPHDHPLGYKHMCIFRPSQMSHSFIKQSQPITGMMVPRSC